MLVAITGDNVRIQSVICVHWPLYQIIIHIAQNRQF